MVLMYRNGNSFGVFTDGAASRFAIHAGGRNGDDRRLIGSTYRDDPVSENGADVAAPEPGDEDRGRGVNAGHAMQPSRLQGDGDAWREA